VRRPSTGPNDDFKITSGQRAVWQKMMLAQSYPFSKLDLDRIVVPLQ
jgi:hypothetical protein